MSEAKAVASHVSWVRGGDGGDGAVAVLIRRGVRYALKITASSSYHELAMQAARDSIDTTICAIELCEKTGDTFGRTEQFYGRVLLAMWAVGEPMRLDHYPAKHQPMGSHAVLETGVDLHKVPT